MGPNKQGHDRYPCTSEESILLIYPTHEKKQESQKGIKCGMQPIVGKRARMLFSMPQTRQKMKASLKSYGKNTANNLQNIKMRICLIGQTQ
jgi:hypothetical protein